MFNTRSIAGRIAVAKVTGLVIGSFTILLLSLFSAETSFEFKMGILLLIVTMSVMIGFVGMFERHPVFPRLVMHWWLRGPSMGIFFFLILVLLTKPELTAIMSLDILAWSGLTSPYWILIDGAILGGLIGYITTKICGEGNLPLT